MAKGKYQEWLQDENLILLKSWAMEGLTDEEISKNIDIHVSTLYDWKNKYPEISDALKKSKKVFDAQVVQALHKAGIGHYIEEVDTDITIRDGVETKRIRKRKRWIPANVTAQIFWLKNRKPDVWMDRKAKEFDLNASEGVKIIDDIG